VHSVTVQSVTVQSDTVQSVTVQSVLLLQRDNIKMLSHNHAKLVLRPSAPQNSAKFPQKLSCSTKLTLHSCREI
jgi:hypothetical protein